MLSPQVIAKGLIARMMPNALTDGPESERPFRQGRYGDLKVEPSCSGNMMLADEGAYMVATTLPGATALQLGISATFSATAAAIVLGNSDPAGGKRLYPQFIRMSVTTAPTAGVDLRYAIVLDSKDRTPTTISNGSGGSGPGTPATATAYRVPTSNTNQDFSPNIAGVPFFPISAAAGVPITIPSAGPFARTIVGNGTIKSSIPVAKDQYTIQFGGTDIGGTFQGAAAIAKIVDHAPPVVVGPGQFLVVYLWALSNITAGIAFDDLALGWVEK